MLGGATLLVAVPYSISVGALGGEALPWLSLGFTFLATAWFLRVRLPDHTIAQWFAVVAGGFAIIQAPDGVLAMLVEAAAQDRVLAVAALGYHVASVATVIAFAHVLGLSPDGLAALRVLVIFPPLVVVTSPTILLTTYLPRRFKHLGGD